MQSLATAWIASAGLAAALAGATANAHQQLAQPVTTCDLQDPGRRWLADALGGWAQIRADSLALGPAPMPWLVLFDESCIWNISPDLSTGFAIGHPITELTVNGTPLALFAAPHDGQIVLPSGRLAGTRPTASTSVYGDGSATFSLVSMFGVWQRDPRHAKQPRLGEFFQGLLIHELTHSTQLVSVFRRVATLRRDNAMQGMIDDDVVQRRFSGVTAFRSAFEAECAAFYRAALATDNTRRRELTQKALLMARTRRARFFTGSNATLSELEDLFFAMEGSAQWAAYRWARATLPSTVTDPDVITFVRADRKYWSQDEGLALYLLIDALVPGWQKRTFGDSIASPFALLEEALGR